VLARFSLLALTALLGCASTPPPKPEGAVRQYLAALDRDDPHGAYTLLQPSLRAHVTESDFTQRWRSSTEERRTQADRLRVALAPGEHPPVGEWAAIIFPDGARVPLARDAGSWHLTSTELGELHAATPAEALRLFVQAAEARRFDVLLNLLGDPLRSEVERQLRERLDKLKAALGKARDLDVSGDRARLLYGSGFHIDLRRQNGEWRVFDLN
jgi:hypothetical protein